MTGMRDLPGPARALSAALSCAVAAARSADREAYESAVGELAACGPDQVGVIAGTVVRELLEDMHPDGLDSDDMHVVLGRCVRATVSWLPGVDVTTLIIVLAGALGIHEAEEAGPPADAEQVSGRTFGASAERAAEEIRPPTRAEVARHAPLIIADLLDASGRNLHDHLRAAFAEIARAETMEMP